MKCPVCLQPDLVMADRQGIEIDYCPQCRGVWLDRGELDKIIERSATLAAPAQPARPERAPEPQGYGGGGYGDQHHKGRYDDDYYKHKRKRRGLLGEIFDFD